MNPIALVLGVVLSPLMVGLINRTKAVAAGRRGPPLLQLYFDVAKLLRKAPVYSETAGWVFRAGPIVTLAGLLAAATLMPLGPLPALWSFPGDVIVFVYLLAIGRFFMVVAALDTGSPFEAMGASREVFFSALVEPAVLLALAALAGAGGGESASALSDMHSRVNTELWADSGLVLAFVGIGFAIIYLAENARIPVDDPNTHLELTMIHEVMILDHSGPDLGYLVYAAALKLWLIGSLIVGLLVPQTGVVALDVSTALAGLAGLAVFVGVTESTMARLRMMRVPQLLVSAVALTVLALVLEHRG